MNINDFLPRNYSPVYGTGITPDSFRPLKTENGHAWGADGLTKNGEEGNYTIVLESDDSTEMTSTDHPVDKSLGSEMATCEVVVGGERRTIQHPYSKQIGGLASVADWYDAIAIEDAKGRKAELTVPWSGQDLDSTLTRVEHNIVAYGDDEIAVSTFSSAVEASKWLENALSATQVRAEVWKIRNAYESDEADERTMLRRFKDDDVDGWAPIPFSTGYISEEWLHHFFGKGQPNPFVHLRMLGAQRESLNADYALSWKELNETGELTLYDSQLEDGTDGWLVIHVVDTDVALPLPWPGTNVVVHHDEDGAQVGIDVYATEVRTARHRRERAWESEWGRFLDDGITLTEAEVSDGIKRAEAELNTLIAEEVES